MLQEEQETLEDLLQSKGMLEVMEAVVVQEVEVDRQQSEQMEM